MAHLPEEIAARTADARQNVESLGEGVRHCGTHGDYTTTGVRYFGRREVWTPCPDCAEEREADARKAEAEETAKVARERIERTMDQAAIPSRFRSRSFENFRVESDAMRHALSVAREFAEKFPEHEERGSNLIFSGLPGTGKSHLAIAVLQALLPERVGMYATCMGVIRAVRETWRRDSERSETQVLKTLADVPLLVVDEIGVQYGTDGEQTILFDVLDRRYREMMPTILLTNQDKKGFAAFIGERTFDRLVETSRWVPFDWPSYRARARKEAEGAV